MGQIVLRILTVGQGNISQRRLFTGYHLHQRLRAVQQRLTQLGKADVAPAGDDVICLLHDFLLVKLVADFRAAQYHLQIGPTGFEHAHQGAGLCDIPDVDPKTNHLRVQRQQLIGQLVCFAGDCELAQHRALP